MNEKVQRGIWNVTFASLLHSDDLPVTLQVVLRAEVSVVDESLECEAHFVCCRSEKIISRLQIT